MQRTLRATVALLLLVGQVASALADTPLQMSRPRPQVDVAVSLDRQVRGQVLSPSGSPIPRVEVQLIQQGRVCGTAVSGPNGIFTVGPVTPGSYVIRSGEFAAVCRVWAPQTAPPAAVDQVLLVETSPTARGQVAGNIWPYYIPAGLIVGGVLAYRFSQSTGS